MATEAHPLLNEGGTTHRGGTAPPLDLDVRKSRLSLWCILFWIVALASLTANSLLLHGDYGTSDNVKTVQRLYLSGACMFLTAIIFTILHLYVVTGNEICKLIGGCLFILGGILHISATSKRVNFSCHDSWCRVRYFASDFMAEYLSIFIGIDIITFYFDKRILRVTGYCCVLSVCCLLMCSYLNHRQSSHDTDYYRTSESAFFITGIVSGAVFIVLLVIQIGNKSVAHAHKETIARYVHLFLGFALMNGAGLVFYTWAAMEYQTLLVIATAVIIAYELQYMG